MTQSLGADDMSATKGDVRSALKAFLMESAGKENMPPEQRKRTSAAGLFDNLPNKRHKRVDDSARASALPSSKTANHASTPGKGFFKRFTRPQKDAVHPLIEGFDRAVAAYQRGVTESDESMFEPIQQEIELRMQGINVTGKLITRPDIPSQAEIKAVKDAFRALQRPLGEETMDVEVPVPGGKTVLKRVTVKQVQEAYKKLHDRKQADIADLEQELQQVEREIAALYHDIPCNNDNKILAADEKLRAAKAQYDLAFKAALDEKDAELRKARAEEKSKCSNLKDRMQAFMASLG
ncbi:hypothetical protein BAUCODRAFT_147687 [Baudoinia panamericana UAMH 10762]|uniref:Uncharacterized protein n=1 Tax=Baudoinia panamericana (strain UAMH 10762) TaxID=717646 RepID=M2NEG5_BAUPA|nr:uncharacterized protein BAUCODRAFT_147687 [Baudoinia panamericana UAMH 10762]EMC97629.1 hypothetical protein BAUCODRAFT_147687 [Baudoinia panamericana UAMH 10762]